MPLTYYTFHLIFNVPLTLFLFWLSRKYLRKEHCFWGMAVLVIVFLFTTPWDNFAVMRNIWNFPEGRYLFRIWHLPLEEYLFFAFESVNVMLLIVWWMGRDRVSEECPPSQLGKLSEPEKREGV